MASSLQIEMPRIKHRYSDGLKRAKVAEWTVNYNDVFKMNYFVLLCREWLIEQGYVTRDDSLFPETMYSERISPGGREIWIRWRCSKDGIKNSPYKSGLYRYDLDIDFHALTLKKVEVMHKGQKYDADKGEVEVNCRANFIFDSRKEIENHWLLKHFKTMLQKKFWRGKIEYHQGALYTEAYRFQEAVKAYLKIDTYLPEKEGSEFWQKRVPD